MKKTRLLICLLGFLFSSYTLASSIFEHRLVELMNFGGGESGVLIKADCKTCSDKFYRLSHEVFYIDFEGKPLPLNSAVFKNYRFYYATLVVDKKTNLITSLLVHSVEK